MQESCARCGEMFCCNAAGDGCWCFDLPAVPPSSTLYNSCLCPKCLARAGNISEIRLKTEDVQLVLVEGQDYYREGETIVFTEGYHLRRGYCCESGCRHCPYERARESQATK